MKAFKIVPSIAEYVDFRTLAKELSLGERDLILTNEYIYNPTIAALNLGCHTCFQEKFGGGEPTDVMVDAKGADCCQVYRPCGRPVRPHGKPREGA